jgi:ABC-type antimicrobial peptide transport system permease subunit
MNAPGSGPADAQLLRSAPRASSGTMLGIPIGTALYAAVQNGGPSGSPPAWWLLAMILAMLLTVTGITAIPARRGARAPVAEILQAEYA